MTSFGFNKISPLGDKAGQIEHGRHEYVQHINDDRGGRIRHTAEDDRQESAVALKEHIVRANGVIDDVGGNRLDQRRNRSQKHLLPAFHLGIAVIAGDQHHQAGEKHRAVEHKGVHSGKRDTGIGRQHRHGIEEIDAGTQQTQGAGIAAGGFLHISLAPDGKGHGVHIQAAGIQWQNAGPFNTNGLAGNAFPNDLGYLQHNHGGPHRNKHGLDGVFLLAHHNGRNDHDGQHDGGKNEVQRSKHRTGELIRRGQEILMGKEIFKQVAEVFHILSLLLS